MAEHRSPFAQMLLSFTPEAFIGRTAVLRNLLQGVRSGVRTGTPTSFTLYGMRTIGKSTLLQYLVHQQETQAPDQDGALGSNKLELKFLYGDFHNVGADVTGALRVLLHSQLDLLKDLNVSDKLIQVLGNPEASRDDIRRTLNSVFRELRFHREARVVTCLDHFDEAFKLMPWDDEFLLSTLARYQPFIVATEQPLVVLLMRSRRKDPPEDRDPDDAMSSLVPLLVPQHLGLLEQVEAREALIRMTREGQPASIMTSATPAPQGLGQSTQVPEEKGVQGLRHPTECPQVADAVIEAGQGMFNTDEVDFLLEQAGRHPSLLTIVCDLYLTLRSQYRASLQENQQQESMQGPPEFLETKKAYFLLRVKELPAIQELFLSFWNRLSKNEHDMLFHIVEQKGKVEDTQVLIELIDKALVREDFRAGTYPIFSPLFATYVERQLLVYKQAAIEQAMQELAPLEQKLFKHFLARPNRVCTFEELMDAIWGGPPHISQRGLEAAMHRLRDRLHQVDNTWQYLLNVRGTGYRYVPKPV